MLASMSGFKVQQIDHVELFVPDQRIAAGWYARVFGMRVLTELEHWVDHGAALSIYFVDPWHHRFEITTYETARTHALLK